MRSIRDSAPRARPDIWTSLSTGRSMREQKRQRRVRMYHDKRKGNAKEDPPL